MKKQKVIIDCDNALTIPVQDTDDAFALVLAMACGQLDILGITTSPGNCRTFQSLRNTLLLLEKAKRGDIPVVMGAKAPLVQNREDHFSYLEKKTLSEEKRYWDKMPLYDEPRLKPSDLTACDFIIDRVKKYPREVTIILLGAHTNLALALKKEPSLDGMIKEIVMMSGAFPPSPDDPPLWITPDIPDHVWEKTLRFNADFDPEGALEIFNSSIPLLFVPVNITTKVFQRPEHMALLKGISSYHDFLYQTGEPWVSWSIKERKLPGAHLHDPLTVGALVKPDLFEFSEMSLNSNAFYSRKGYWLCPGAGKRIVRVGVNVHVLDFEKYFSKTILL